jgi:hypothetical protein
MVLVYVGSRDCSQIGIGLVFTDVPYVDEIPVNEGGLLV